MSVYSGYERNLILFSTWLKCMSFYTMLSSLLMSVFILCVFPCVSVFVCTGKSHGEQAQRDDGQRKSVHPRTTDKLHGTYRHAHLQVRKRN